MAPLKQLAVLVLFLVVLYPLVQTMTRIKGRAGMFIWRHQLADRRGPYWQSAGVKS